MILYDRLIPSAALDGARAEAEVLFVGKEGGGPSVPQEQTEALILDRARAGKTVVRLKGGDPFVFGRGGEEALALRDAGIPFEIVPGDHLGRGRGRLRGHPRDPSRARDRGGARDRAHPRGGARGVGARLAGARRVPGDARLLHGRAPAAADHRVARSPPDVPPTSPWRSSNAARSPISAPSRGRFGTSPSSRGAEQVRAPAITVVGAVAGLTEELEWRGDGTRYPLAGRTVAVTRARAQASGLARRLEELGASVVQAPVIRTQPLPGPTLDLEPYDLVCFTSPNAVSALFERLAQADRRTRRDARAFAGIRVAAIGPGTARALAEHGLVADIVPERSVAESLVQALADVPVQRALVARAREARDVLPDALRARGAEVDVLALYETVAEPLSPRALQQARAADYITFTSSSTVRFFLDAAGGADGLSPETRIVSIGPVTSETLREHGLEPHVEAEDHDVDGVVRALLRDVAARAV